MRFNFSNNFTQFFDYEKLEKEKDVINWEEIVFFF